MDIRKHTVVQNEIVLKLSEEEAWGLLATLGRVVEGPTDGKDGSNMYATLANVIFSERGGETSREYEEWYRGQSISFAPKHAGYPV